MRKILLLLFCLTFASAEINEYLSDVYFANGIATTKEESYHSIDKIEEKFKLSNPQAYKYIADWKTSYNHTHGIGIDLYESMLQKIYEDDPGDSLVPFIWNMDEIADYFVWSFKGIVRQIAKKAPKAEIKFYAASVAKKLARKVVYSYNKDFGKKFTEEQIEAMFVNVFDYLIEKGIDSYVTMSEEEIIEQERVDVATHITNYVRSVSLGHGVIIVAHSQGNLFTNRAYKDLEFSDTIHGLGWVRDYMSAIGIATPANNILGEDSPYMTFDNDMIQLVPDSLTANVTNPKRYPIYNALGDNIGETFYSVKAHSFLSSYMATDVTKNAIMGFIEQKVQEHKAKESQWKIAKENGCVCKNKYVQMEHRNSLNQAYVDLNRPGLTDILSNFIEIQEAQIKNFSKDGKSKIYSVEGQYVHASEGGVTIEEIEEDTDEKEIICYALKDDANDQIGNIKGLKDMPVATHGAVEVTLSWGAAKNDFNLKLDMPKSIKDVEACQMEHAYVESEYQIYPGRYPVNVTCANEANATSDEVYISISTPGEGKILKFDTNTTGFSPGHVADIIVKYAEGKPVIELELIEESVQMFSTPIEHIGGGGWNSSGGGGGGGDTVSPERYIPLLPCSPAKSCGCVACEYKIISYLSQALMGPLSGADIMLYNTESYAANTPIYSGKTTEGRELYSAGLLDIPASTIESLDDDGLYIIEVSGGKDIDYDDDMVVDAVASTNTAVLHAVLKGSDLKTSKPKVSIVSEIAYQIVHEAIISGKTQEEIMETLDDVATRMLSVKIYPTSSDPINHTDLLEWIPSIDQSILIADYDTKIKPIVDKLQAGKDIYQDAYDVVYALDAIVPTIKSNIFNVAENVPIGTEVGQVSVVKPGASLITQFILFGENKDAFSIDTNGTICTTKELNYETQTLYSLYVRAKNDEGYSPYTALYIQVEDVVDAPFVLSFTGELVYANALVGTKVAQIVFDSGASAITSMRLGGADAGYFDIDLNGTITLKTPLEDFFTKKAYSVNVVAVNDEGESRVANIVINIGDRRDIPTINSFYGYVDENAEAGTQIGSVPIIDDGDSPITSFTLSDTNQFVIDTQGILYVAPTAQLDYETKNEFLLDVIASNVIGDSHSKTVGIRLKDVVDTPPKLKDITITIDAETAVDTVITNILESSGDSTINEFTLAPDSLFEVDYQGNVKVKSSLLEQSDTEFSISAVAKNTAGESSSALNITLNTAPRVESFTKTVYDNTSPEVVVGKVHVVANGNSIESLELQGAGSEDFEIALDGTLKTATTLKASTQANYQLSVVLNGTYESQVEIIVRDRIIGSVDTPGYARGVTLSSDGTKAYVADGNLGLQIIDISDTTSPAIIGSVDTPNYAYGITLSTDGTKAYVADYQSGLQIIDISDATSPAIIGSVDTPNYAYGITLSTDGTKAYVADYQSGLQIIDISDATSPAIIGSVDTPGSAYYVTLSSDGTKAYVADTQSGLQIIDISDATSPAIIGSVDTPGYAYDVTLSSDGTKAYVADYQSGLQIIDISDATSPAIIGSVDTPGYAYDVTLSSDGTKAYVADTQSGLQIIDISGIDVPDKIPGILGFSTILEEDTSEESYVGEVKTYYTGNSGISSFKLIGEGANDFTIDAQGVVRLKNSLNYSACNIYNLKAEATNAIGAKEVDVTIRLHSIPEFKDFTGSVNSMAQEGTYIGQIDMWIDTNETISDISLFGTGADNFRVDTNGKIYTTAGADLHHFVTPQYDLGVSAANHYGSSEASKVSIKVNEMVSSVDTPGSAYDVTLSSDGTKAYVADNQSGLQIIDISDATSPAIISSVDTPDNAYDVTLSSDGTKAYVADNQSGLQIIDISDTTSPAIIGSVDTPHYARGVTLSSDGTKAYVADTQSGLQIIDISDATSPAIIGSVDTPHFARGVTLSSDGTKAYVADGNLGLQIIDISDTTSPAIIGSVDTPGSAYYVTLSSDGTKAYVADTQSGLQIIDISDATSPAIIGSVDTPGYAYDVTLSSDGTKAYVADYQSGLQIIDISDATSPAIIGSVDTPGYAYDVTLSSDGTKAYVADNQSGLQIIDLTGLE